MAGGFGFVAELLNATSLFYYEEARKDAKERQRGGLLAAVAAATARLFAVLLVYNTEKVAIAIFVSSFYLARILPHATVSAWVLFGILYLRTFRGRPSQSGHRARPEARGHWVFNQIAQYFQLVWVVMVGRGGGVEMVKEGGGWEEGQGERERAHEVDPPPLLFVQAQHLEGQGKRLLPWKRKVHLWVGPSPGVQTQPLHSSSNPLPPPTPPPPQGSIHTPSCRSLWAGCT